jgi:hypothetical protein
MADVCPGRVHGGSSIVDRTASESLVPCNASKLSETATASDRQCSNANCLTKVVMGPARAKRFSFEQLQQRRTLRNLCPAWLNDRREISSTVGQTKASASASFVTGNSAGEPSATVTFTESSTVSSTTAKNVAKLLILMIGAARFELATPCAQGR